MIRIESQDRASYVLVAEEERVVDRLPGRRLRVEAQLGAFSGRHDRVWIDEESLRSFVARLKELERRREGRAVLESMSPRELVLAVEVVDTAGHIAVSLQLGRELRVGGGPRWCGVEGAFEMDAGELERLVRELSRSLEPAAQPPA